jgi:predicted PurR-regulated permease PerM
MLGAAALLLLMLGCFFVIRPFMTALMWAIILAYCLHPLQRMFTRWFRGSRTLAACFVTLTVAILLAGPIAVVGVSLAKDGRELTVATRDWFMSASEKPPKWLVNVPVYGDELTGYWVQFVESRDRWMSKLDEEVKQPVDGKANPRKSTESVQETDAKVRETLDSTKLDDSTDLAVQVGRIVTGLRSKLLALGRVIGQGVAEVLLSAFLAFFLLRDSAELSRRLNVVVGRLAGERGGHLIKVAGATVNGVIYGVLGTAVAQAIVAGIGFSIAGVPGAVLLAVLTFLVAVVPFGPPMIWLPAALWLYTQNQHGWAVFMLIWGALGISSVDNLVRPFLISQGTKLPFALIFCGVIGGALAFGLVGIFMGPTLLAVAFRLIEEWSRSVENEAAGGISSLPVPEPSATSPAHGSEPVGIGESGGGIRAELS